MQTRSCLVVIRRSTPSGVCSTGSTLITANQPALMLKDVLTTRLGEVEQRGLYRRLRLVSGAQESTIVLNGREVILLSSNNYLGLANHPTLKHAAQEAIARLGCSSGASRLISGHMDIHRALEEKLAAFKHAEAALGFPSGYHANIGVISALMDPGDTIFSDEL